MRRFFVDSSAITEGELVITSPDDIRHISRALRLSPGAFLDVSDSAAYEYRAEILEIQKDRVTCRIHDKQKFSGEPATQVTLYQGIPKQAKMETIVQKCVELGITRIVPVFTHRTVVVETDHFGKKLERWQKVAAEAVKQCGRGLIPEVGPALRFSQMAEEFSEDNPYDLTLFLYENEEQTTIKQVLSTLPKEGGPWRIAIVIGPEGGFSDQEAERLKASNTWCATLGKTILRTETAGSAALAMVMYQLEL